MGIVLGCITAAPTGLLSSLGGGLLKGKERGVKGGKLGGGIEIRGPHNSGGEVNESSKGPGSVASLGSMVGPLLLGNQNREALSSGSLAALLLIS